MSTRGEVLVAILNDPLDFAILRERQWYRIPVHSVDRWLYNCWPPKWLSFYQTKVFGDEAYAVNYYSQVVDIKKARRLELFPDEGLNENSNRHYYQVFVQPIQRLPRPINSRRWRMIVFIPTTWLKFSNAEEINDLYDESPLEDQLWAHFKRLKISAERQEFVRVKKQDYALDFAIYCPKGNIDIETDGDTWHSNPEKAAGDNLRDNALKTVGWKVLRFNTPQIKEQIESYCLPTIAENINKLGGVEEGKILPRKINLEDTGTYQLSLFDDM
jgi:very-short-patch-repair endonuclease